MIRFFHIALVLLLPVVAAAVSLPELIPFRKGDKWGYADSTKKIIVPCRFTKVTQLERGYGLVFNGEKYGFVDSTGRLFHEAEFGFSPDHCSYSFEGNFLRVTKNGKSGTVDRQGNWRVEPVYDHLEFMGKGLLRAVRDEKQGLVDTAGKVIVALAYDDVRTAYRGLYVVSKNRKYGIIDGTGKVVTPFRYDWTGVFHEGMMTVFSTKGEENNVLGGFVDSTGKEVVPCMYESCGDFSNGRAVVGNNFKYGYIDKKGKLVIPLQYRCAGSFSCGLASAGLDGKYGYIDTTGKLVAPMVYKTMHNTCGEEFRNGTVAVMRDWKWTVLDTSGQEIIPPGYSNIYLDHKSRYVYFEENEKQGIMTVDRRVVIPAIYAACSYHEGIFVLYLERDGRFFYLSENGDTLSGKIYDRGDNTSYFTVPHFNEGRGLIIENGKAGFIDSTGRVVVPCKYDSAWVFRDGISLVESAGKAGYVDRYGMEYWEE